MIVSLNGFTINDPNSPTGVYLQEPVDGLGMAPVRTSSGNYSGRDGGYVGAQFYGMRLITLTGEIRGTSAADLDAKRQAFEAAVAASPIIMNITTTGGLLRTITCYVDPSLEIPVVQTPTIAPYHLSLVAPDPVIYDASAGGLMTASISRSGGGGLTWPITWPITWPSGTPPTTINNTGNVVLYPLITLNDVMTNPVITNQTTGQFFALSGLTTTSGDVVVIDLKNHTVLLNGGSALPYATLTSSWWGLVSGNNSIALTTSSAGDTVTGTIQWRAGYRGI